MRSFVIYAPDGLTLDFVEPDFGGPDQVAVIRAWQERGHHARYRGEFTCFTHRDHEHAAVYLRQLDQHRIVAAHYAGFRHTITHHGITPAHQFEVEYVGRAGEAGGYEFRREVSLPTKVRSDAVLYGGRVTMGVEVQRSHLTVSAAKQRTTKARRAGVEPVWFADSWATPGWFGHVPSVRMNPDTSWAALPGQRTVTVVSGVRSLVPRRCREFYNNQCPRRFRGCNDWHADHDPLPLLVDDLAERMPAAELVPILFRTLSGREQVLIFSAADKARYESLVGAAADLPLAGRRSDRFRPAERLDCTADAGAVLPATAAEPDELLLFDVPESTPRRDVSRWTR